MRGDGKDGWICATCNKPFYDPPEKDIFGLIVEQCRCCLAHSLREGAGGK